MALAVEGAAEPYDRPHQRCVVGVGGGNGVRQRDRCVADAEQCGRRDVLDTRRVIDAVDRDDDAAGRRGRASVVEVVPDRHRGGRRFASVGIVDLLQHGVDAVAGRLAVEGDGERAVCIDIGTNRNQACQATFIEKDLAVGQSECAAGIE